MADPGTPEVAGLSETERQRIRMRVWSMLEDLATEMGDEDRVAEAKTLSVAVAANLVPTIEQIVGERLATMKQLDGHPSSSTESITVATPTMGTETERVAELLMDAAWKLRHGYSPGGSTVTGSLANLCENAARAIDPTARTHYGNLYPPANGVGPDVDITELTYEERCALPARYHLPLFEALSSAPSWICKVCWDDGLTTAWPCKPAQNGGIDVATAAGLEYAS